MIAAGCVTFVIADDALTCILCTYACVFVIVFGSLEGRILAPISFDELEDGDHCGARSHEAKSP